MLISSALAALGFGIAAALSAPGERGSWVEGTLFAGALVGVGAAMLVSGAAVGWGLGFTALAVVAARGPLGRMLGPVVAGAPIFYGALCMDRAAEGVLPWLLVTWLFALRALLPAGAARLGRREWVAAALALAYVPASFLLPARRGFSGYYFLTVLFADLVLLVVATRVLVGRREGLGAFVTTALGLSVVALVAGRVL